MTSWERVVEATEGHNLDTFTVQVAGDDRQAYVYLRCSCGEPSEAFTEDWEFTDHIRRIVFAVLEAPSQP